MENGLRKSTRASRLAPKFVLVVPLTHSDACHPLGWRFSSGSFATSLDLLLDDANRRPLNLLALLLLLEPTPVLLLLRIYYPILS